jgi:hypothetical protein
MDLVDPDPNPAFSRGPRAGRPYFASAGRVMGAHLELSSTLRRQDRGRRTAILYFARFASHSRMKAISAVCVLTISSASLRVSGSFPYFKTISAMSIAPW